MKTAIFRICISAVFLLTIAAACTSEAPFSNEGMGTLRMNVSVNSKLTRAEITGEENQKLLDNCVIYISDEIGLLHKWVGVSNIPDQLSLKYGNYVAEAWSGDSVSASFESKFYKGLEKFNLSADAPSKTISIRCKLANVVGSVDDESIKPDVMKNVVVTIGNSRASLEYNNETMREKGYFMMPDDETELKYTVTGEKIDGEPFTLDGVIENVEPGHEYRLEFITNPEEFNSGGLFFDIVIKEFENEIDAEQVILGKPNFYWAQPAIGEKDQIIGTQGEFSDAILLIAANSPVTSFVIETKDFAPYFNNNPKYELVNVEDGYDTYLTQLGNKGIEVEKGEEANEDGLYKWKLTFKKELFNNLPTSDTEYKMTITVTDSNTETPDKKGKTNSIDVRIANTEAAITYDDPIIIDFESFNSDLTLVSANSVTIPVKIVDDSQKILLQYKKENDSDWKSKDVLATRADDRTVNITLTGLEEGTTYEYRVVAGEETDGKYKFESEIDKFTTEEKFKIPNSSMEEWSEDSGIVEPSSLNDVHKFWDTGNHGAKVANVTLTQSSDEIVGSGNLSARLRSQKATVIGIGKHAAGNLFVGKYIKTSGTNGVIDFGQEYNASHPKSVKVQVNYRPGIVSETGSGQSVLKKGDTDHGQIYIALTTEKITVDTGDKSTLFEFQKDTDKVLAFGEKTFTENYGDDGQLKELIIDFDYKDIAKTVKPKYLVIVCSASKYGDYFAGGEGSLMYVDDFELLYE